jgi:hypothetical protein
MDWWEVTRAKGYLVLAGVTAVTTGVTTSATSTTLVLLGTTLISALAQSATTTASTTFFVHESVHFYILYTDFNFLRVSVKK